MSVDIPKGFTPGPWWTDARYDGRQMGCAIIAANTDCGPLPGNPTRGAVAFATALLNTEARRCEANARLIALAPDMAAEIAALRAERDAKDAQIAGLVDALERARHTLAVSNGAYATDIHPENREALLANGHQIEWQIDNLGDIEAIDAALTAALAERDLGRRK